MAKIEPFQPYRYTSAAGPVERLVTQPYDKISPEMRARYLDASPYNLVRIILGERFASDDERNNTYTRAAQYLDTWIAAGLLAKETEPSLFAYFQEFSPADSAVPLMRKGFIGLGMLEEYSARIVHRHEQTLSGPKKDRIELLRQTRAHYGQIFMLYPDPAQEIDRLLDASAQGEPLATIADEYGAVHRLWKISDPARIREIQALMGGKKLLIADGHHRYETALAFRNAHPELEDARLVMMTFVNMYSPGVRILATHRVVSGLEAFEPAPFLRSIGARPLGSLSDLKSLFAADAPERVRIGIAIHGIPEVYLFERPRQAGDLDVKILHDELLGGALGISEEAVREEKYQHYVRGIDAAYDQVANGSAQIAFLLEPTRIEQVAEVAFGGGVMPQKSTDFFPKLLSGLTIFRLEK